MHTSEWEKSDDGFVSVKCAECPWSFVAPDSETAGDAWGSHMYELGFAAGLEGE